MVMKTHDLDNFRVNSGHSCAAFVWNASGTDPDHFGALAASPLVEPIFTDEEARETLPRCREPYTT